MTHVLTSTLLSLPLVGAYAMFALGIVVIYRASRILNLAHGAMATVPAYIAYSLSKAGVPMGVVLPLAISSGAALGMIVERMVLRPLRDSSQTTQTVGTVAVLGVLVALVAKIWGTAPLSAPGVFPPGSIHVGRSILQVGEIGLFGVALIVAAITTVLFRATDLGLAMRGAAENRRASMLMGVDPDRTTAAAWAIGGALAAGAGVLLAGVTNLHPYTLSRQVLPAFVAALIGGLGSMTGAIAGAVVVGFAQGFVGGLGSLGRQPGMAQLVLTIVALAVMATRGKRLSTAAETAGSAEAASARPRRRPSLKSPWVVLGAVALLAWPFIPLPQSLHGLADSLRGDAAVAAIYSVVAVSLVVLTGWVGQISLAQASFVGVSAFTTGVLVRTAGIPFPLNLPIAAVVAAAVAALLGVVALRVRGLYLAVATLIFGWMADAYLFHQSWLVGEGGSSTIGSRVIGARGGFPSFDLTDRRSFYYIALAAAAVAVLAAANLRDSRTGRAMFAVRGSEVAAASLGINVTRTKLFAFAASGLLAGVAGNLIMVSQRTAAANQFAFTWSLFYLAIAAVGGLVRLGGAVAAAVLFAGLNELFFRFQFLGGYLEIVSSGLLLVAVLSSAPAVRARLRAARERRRSHAAPAAMLDAPALPAAPGTVHANGAAALDVAGITVRFGGLVAVDDASLRVGAGEIVGLIGPNGAGKTTLFNAIGGLNSPASGTVRVFGRDVTALGVHERAEAGIGRTFQVIQLFAESTVEENLLVATHRHATTGPVSHLFVTDAALADETAARARVREVSALVGLDPVLEARAGDLPFGVLRMVEVARALVTGARLLLLDEPASGLDNRETDRLGELLFAVRSSLGISLLVVEHDVGFVTALSDRLCVLDQGRIIAEGTPGEVRADAAVVAAYLGPGSEREPVLAR